MKKLFLSILLILIAFSLFIRFTQPEVKAGKIILYWKTDANPQRFDQIDLFHKWLVKNGHVDKKGEPLFELRVDTANIQSKLIQAVSGVGGDIMDVVVTEFEPMGVLHPIGDATNESDYSLDKTYAGLEKDLIIDGNQYGYPCNVNALGFWYNVSTFKKLGLELPPEFWTPEEYEKIGKEFVKRANVGRKRREVYFSDNPATEWTGTRMLVCMYRSLGLDDFNETRTLCTLNDERYARVLKLIHKWTFEDHLFPSAAEVASMSAESGYGGNAFANLQHGLYGMVFIGRFCLIRMRQFEPRPVLGLSLAPEWDFRNAALSSRNAVLYEGSKHKDYARLFFSFLADKEYNDYIVAGADGLPPNPKYAGGNPAFEKPLKYTNEGNVHMRELNWARTIGITMPQSPYYKATGTDWKKYGIEKYFNNLMTVDEAVKEISDRMNKAILQTVKDNAVIAEKYKQDLEIQKKIDEYKAAGKKLPASWIKNAFHLKYYRSKGMILEDR